MKKILLLFAVLLLVIGVSAQTNYTYNVDLAQYLVVKEDGIESLSVLINEFDLADFTREEGKISVSLDKKPSSIILINRDEFGSIDIFMDVDVDGKIDSLKIMLQSGEVRSSYSFKHDADGKVIGVDSEHLKSRSVFSVLSTESKITFASNGNILLKEEKINYVIDGSAYGGEKETLSETYRYRFNYSRGYVSTSSMSLSYPSVCILHQLVPIADYKYNYLQTLSLKTITGDYDYTREVDMTAVNQHLGNGYIKIDFPVRNEFFVSYILPKFKKFDTFVLLLENSQKPSFSLSPVYSDYFVVRDNENTILGDFCNLKSDNIYAFMDHSEKKMIYYDDNLKHIDTNLDGYIDYSITSHGMKTTSYKGKSLALSDERITKGVNMFTSRYGNARTQYVPPPPVVTGEPWKVYFENKFGLPIMVWIHYKDYRTGEWVTKGGFKIPTNGEETLLFRTKNRIFYYYAEYVGTNFWGTSKSTWEGSDHYETIGGVQVGMIKKRIDAPNLSGQKKVISLVD